MAIHCASQEGQLEVIKLLVDDYLCSFTHKDGGHGVTPLHLAASAGHTEILSFFASKDESSLEVKDKHGRTPLHYACQDGHKNVVKLLKEHGCNFDHKDKKGITPKTLAMLSGHNDIIKMLGGGPSTESIPNVSVLSREAWRCRVCFLLE